jgi:hypothetical protein
MTEPLRVCREKIQQQILNYYRDPESDQKRRFIPAAYDPVEQGSLDPESDKEHQRDHDTHGNYRVVEDRHKDEADITSENEEVAVREVCDPYYPEYHAHTQTDSRV